MVVLKNISIEDLEKVAKSFVNCLKGNEVILLIGDLGSGKTTFTKLLVKSIDSELEDEVNSPTFTIMNIYETNRFPIYHLDLYRVKSFDVSDILGNGVVLIEWANIDEFEDIDIPIVIVKLEIGDDIDKRNITIDFKNGDYLERCFRGS